MQRLTPFAIALLLLAACSDGGGAQPVDERLAGAGTELGGGFAVPAATRLLGREPTGREWYVDLLLVGDPRDAADDVVRTALDAGFGVDAHCSSSDVRTVCAVRGLRTEGGWVREQVYLQLERSSGGEGPYRSGGHLGYSAWPAGANDIGRGVEDLVDDLGPLPRPELPPADDAPDLPDVGEQIAGDGELIGVDVVVVEGSEVVAPIQPSPCVTGGFDAHLIITGDVDAVVDGYAAQFDRWGEGDVERRESADGIRVGTSDLGGGDISLEVELDGEEPVWATVSRCND
jgi:hypothetical protein